MERGFGALDHLMPKFVAIGHFGSEIRVLAIGAINGCLHLLHFLLHLAHQLIGIDQVMRPDLVLVL